MAAAPAPITRAHLHRFLTIGLGVSALLLLSALLVAWRTVHQIDRDTELFATRQSLAKAAIDNIQKDQAELNANWLRLARKSDVIKREELITQLAQARDQMTSALQSAYEQAEFLRQSIYQEGHGLLRWTVWLFAACVGLSLLCASWAVQASAGVFRRLEQQAAELSQMQYQFLETQENVARRFSHELHDELGQALTAVKANLSALRSTPADEARLDDCMTLVDRAIKDVREMSQLLRPTILDDFGLDAALRSLADNFSQRTGISTKYTSNLQGRRLRDETETHLFRIAQEALTNVARHSQATSVSIELEQHGDEVSLSIRDNGHGFDVADKRGSQGLGLAGMQTRARGCGGTLRVNSSSGKGVEIEVACPIGR
ncbi:MAG: sensor histidine kinase [Acidobacteriaceae bacterium]|nr:sensor histidine kinase [Acidobacteriaceae bacterium]